MKYHNILKSSKVQSISKKVIECEHDVKKMYRLINNITGRTSENPMPENVSDETLLNDFANFFMDKIQKICTMNYNNMINTHQLETPISIYYQALEK